MLTKHELKAILSTPATQSIDADIVTSIVGSPPFISVSGLFNIRDLSDDTIHLRPSYIYRSGTLERLTSRGAQTLSFLGITHIFDLRSERECKSTPTPELPEFTVSWRPSTYDDPTNPVRITSTTYQNVTTGEYSLVQMYLDMLVSHRNSLKAVFEHILHHPDMPFLFHCTAGKDRTGLLAALILGLAEVDLDYVNHDYALTRVGVEPLREFLMQKWKATNPEIDERSKNAQSAMRFP